MPNTQNTQKHSLFTSATGPHPFTIFLVASELVVFYIRLGPTNYIVYVFSCRAHHGPRHDTSKFHQPFGKNNSLDFNLICFIMDLIGFGIRWPLLANKCCFVHNLQFRLSRLSQPNLACPRRNCVCVCLCIEYEAVALYLLFCLIILISFFLLDQQ